MTETPDVQPSQSSPEELEASRQAGQALFQKFVEAQRAKYGDNWKDSLAAEMTERMAPVMKAFLPKPEETAATPQKDDEG